MSMMRQRRVILGRKCAVIVSDVDDGETVHLWGKVTGVISVPSSQFYCKLKTALKNKVFKKKKKV